MSGVTLSMFSVRAGSLSGATAARASVMTDKSNPFSAHVPPRASRFGMPCLGKTLVQRGLPSRGQSAALKDRRACCNFVCFGVKSRDGDDENQVQVPSSNLPFENRQKAASNRSNPREISEYSVKHENASPETGFAFSSKQHAINTFAGQVCCARRLTAPSKTGSRNLCFRAAAHQPQASPMLTVQQPPHLLWACRTGRPSNRRQSGRSIGLCDLLRSPCR